MKNKITLSLVLALASILFITSCQKEEDPINNPPVPSEKMVTLDVHFNTVSNEQTRPLIWLGTPYLTEEGDSIIFDFVRYWIGGIEFVSEVDSVWVEAPYYRLIEQTGTSNKNSFTLQIPEGHYKSMRFVVGVKPNQNSSLDSIVGELNPTIGMSWNWNTGYIFMKNEGKFYNSSNSEWETFKYHLGMNENLQTVTLPLDNSTHIHADKSYELNINYHAFKIFSEPNVMDLQAFPTLMVGPADQTARASENYGKAFELGSFEAK